MKAPRAERVKRLLHECCTSDADGPSEPVCVCEVYHKLEDAKFLLRLLGLGLELEPFSIGSQQDFEAQFWQFCNCLKLERWNLVSRKHKRKNYYEVLGVPSVASQLEIKKAGYFSFFVVICGQRL
eukprot:Skav222351  [mRNA]  locus=scaffold3497:176827:177201:+ [translate_table: standard]